MNSELGLSIIMKTIKLEKRREDSGERELSTGAEYVQVVFNVSHFGH